MASPATALTAVPTMAAVPTENDFDLVVRNEREGEIQCIEMSGSEHGQLKTYLAIVRGEHSSDGQGYAKSRIERTLAAEVLPKLLQFVNSSDEFPLRMIDAMLTIYIRGFEGTDYPERLCTIEEFVLDLIEKYQSGLATPDEVEEVLSRFREDFDSAVSTAQRLADRGVVLTRAATA